MALAVHKIFLRQFHTSLCCTSIHKTMKKILGSSSKKKHRYIDNSGVAPSPTYFSKGSLEGKRSVNSKRATVLNKLFMRYITDLMATGESAPQLLGHGIEVNRVKITPDYKLVRVYWLASNSENDDQIELLLKKNAGILRHELSQLRVMGEVPIIVFMKDRHYAKVMEIDTLLAQADFGEDHMPVAIADKLKTQLELYTPLSSAQKEKLEEIDKEVDDFEEPLPVMTHDVFGLNHSAILDKVKKLMKKSEALHRLSSNTDQNSDRVSLNVNDNPVIYSDNKAERAAFKEFLVKRQIMQSKLKKRDKNYTPDIEYIREELREKSLRHFENLDIYDNEDDDFIVDDEENEEIK